MATSYRKGLVAEIFAAAFLTLKGYRIRAWRYKTAVGEIDLIAQRGRTLVFIEVKARPTLDDGLVAIRQGSYSRLQRAAEHYLARVAAQGSFDHVRFDLVVMAPPCRIRHLDNIILYGS